MQACSRINGAEKSLLGPKASLSVAHLSTFFMQLWPTTVKQLHHDSTGIILYQCAYPDVGGAGDGRFDNPQVAGGSLVRVKAGDGQKSGCDRRLA